ncbi:D-ribose pyranase [Salimicrobium flavidum]|uniref:D-ribose pyranase n=1 Tax=Salimicrobium flavidum TaxID=570947 RepID=A0A1N7IS51_9BACI|nr:D-ribose pyranase [Salimicrobium flavidum]SIS39801.1 ribose transport protein RbsD [Salimicrobium flavidum]
MKKHGILNRDINAALSKLGHTDTIVIADCGLPIPENVECVDLSLYIGVPSFNRVFSLLLEEMETERVTLAEEIKNNNEEVHKVISETGLPLTFIKHKELKEKLTETKLVIRTGEATPFANAILQSGVIF